MDVLSNIIRLFETTGKQQRDLADYLGINAKTITSWKSGLSHSYTKYISQIAEFFGVSVDYILGTEQSEANNERQEMIDFFRRLSDEDLQKAYQIIKVVKSND